MSAVKKFLKWAFVVLLIGALFTCVSSRNYLGIILAVVLIPLIIFPLEKIVEKTKIQITPKNKKWLVIVGFFILMMSFSSAANNTTTTNQSTQSAVVTKPEIQKTAELSIENKKDLQESYIAFVAIPKGADESLSIWQKNLSSGASTADAYLQVDTLIALNDNVRSRASSLVAPAYLSSESKDKFNKAKDDMSTAYYSKNKALEQAKIYLNNKDLEALSKFKKQLELANAFSVTAITSMMAVLVDNKVEIPALTK